MAAKITLAELAKHRTRDDCWMVIDGKVYDVTSFMEEHPGGDDVLVESSGKDATLDFEDVGHSDAARDQLADFYVGEADIPVVSKATTNSSQKVAPKPPVVSSSSSGLAWKLLQFSVPLVALGIAYYVKVQLQSTEV